MRRFWILLAFAFVDLLVAGILAGRGDRNLALVFLALAGVLGLLAFVGGRRQQYDAHGRKIERDTPYAAILGTVGALAIVGAAVTVFVLTSKPRAIEAAAPTRPPAIERHGRYPPPEPPARPRYTRPPGLGCMIRGNGECRCIDGQGRRLDVEDRRCREFATQG